VFSVKIKQVEPILVVHVLSLVTCHVIPPCASSTDEEGFGASVTCGICAQSQKKPTSDSEVENLSDDIEEGPVKKKNCYTVDKKLEAVAYAKMHSIHATARHFNVTRQRIYDWKSQEGALRALYLCHVVTLSDHYIYAMWSHCFIRRL
jgi:hypothetical protein